MGKLLDTKKDPEQEALLLLKGLGYRVLSPISSTQQMTNTELLNYFYFELENVLGSEFSIISRGATAEDRKSLKAYQARAKKLGLSARQANFELYKVLCLFFKHYRRIGLQNSPGSLKCLLASSGSWILQKAVSLDKNNLRQSYSPEFEEKLDELCSVPSDKFIEKRKARQQALADELTEE